MNLDLDPAQRELVETLRKTASTGSASEALDAAGVLPPGAFEWCLVFEELGTRVARLDLPQIDLLSRAGYAVGVGRGCLELAQERAGDRVIAGRPLIEFQGPAHRLANVAVDLAAARVGLWRTAWWCDQGKVVAEQAAAAAAACVTAAVGCAHELVQIFGAAGTSEPDVVRRYQAAYELPALCGSPGELWRAAAR
ncbi:MAG TPA: acyl-CoA dehydrogenase family protein [Pseudonocardiaceae bacterium]|jgi:alkylation response protein AidB-like acyl-CoA dehydrogenase|nr:acyl-CoA dehydrogenase family protein [Pseudonocardiaceae bacterium]